jgi:hypothetical protein
MWPFEILLLLTEFSVLVLMFLPIFPSRVGLRYFPIVAVLVTFVQLLIDGPRWQMVPAYMVIALFFTNGLSRKFLIMLSGAGLFASLILSMVIPVFHFQKPTGPYEIGTVTYHCVDASRREVFNTNIKPTKNSWLKSGIQLNTTRYYSKPLICQTRNPCQLHRANCIIGHPSG